MPKKQITFNRVTDDIVVFALNKKKLQAFVNTYGEQQALGYIKAMHDFRKSIDDTLGNIKGTNPNFMVRKLNLFIDHFDEVLIQCESVISLPEGEGTPVNKSKVKPL